MSRPNIWHHNNLGSSGAVMLGFGGVDVWVVGCVYAGVRGLCCREYSRRLLKRFFFSMKQSVFCHFSCVIVCVRTH